ncbi:MAG: hypothetical protein ACPGN3_02345 [Opitutales bacterium]
MKTSLSLLCVCLIASGCANMNSGQSSGKSGAMDASMAASSEKPAAESIEATISTPLATEVDPAGKATLIEKALGAVLEANPKLSAENLSVHHVLYNMDNVGPRANNQIEVVFLKKDSDVVRKGKSDFRISEPSITATFDAAGELVGVKNGRLGYRIKEAELQSHLDAGYAMFEPKKKKKKKQ